MYILAAGWTLFLGFCSVLHRSTYKNFEIHTSLLKFFVSIRVRSLVPTFSFNLWNVTILQGIRKILIRSTLGFRNKDSILSYDGTSLHFLLGRICPEPEARPIHLLRLGLIFVQTVKTYTHDLHFCISGDDKLKNTSPTLQLCVQVKTYPVSLSTKEGRVNTRGSTTPHAQNAYFSQVEMMIPNHGSMARFRSSPRIYIPILPIFN